MLYIIFIDKSTGGKNHLSLRDTLLLIEPFL